jgi:LysM repeat protein
MAEGLKDYVSIVSERMESIRKTLKGLQRENFYKETFGAFETPMLEDVPEDVAENWIDQLTIKQFNEELSDVFPYIYKLVSEANKAKELTPDDLLGETDAPQDNDRNIRGTGSFDRIQGPANTVKVRPGMTIFSIAQALNDQNNMGGDVKQFVKDIMDMNNISNPQQLQVGQVLEIPYSMGTGPDGASRGLPPGGFTNYESQIENAFEELMGQFTEEHSEDNDIEVEAEEEQKTPLGEFILSYFDYTTGQFPKGETAVLTMVEKDYGEQFITPAKQFLEKINHRVSEVMGYKEEEPVVQDNTELDAIRSLAGV